MVVGAMGAGSMHLAWGCLKRGWTPMAVMGMLTAVFCAALFWATRGPVVAIAAMVACAAVGLWMLKNVKRNVPEAEKAAQQLKLAAPATAAWASAA